MSRNLFFLDFDGVVCDSVPECFLSSHLAYHELLRGETVTEVRLKEKELFYEYRPFIRSGEDYIVLHDMIRRGIAVTKQSILDEELEKASPELMERYKELFYRARERVLGGERDFWLRLNPLFPGMHGLLSRAAAHPGFYILSTKKPEYIREILEHHGIDWDLGRILFPGPRTKLEIIESVLPLGEGRLAYFVDDQLDHLLTARKNPAVRPYLASWGYVKKEWLLQKDVPVVTLEDLGRVAADFLTVPVPGTILPPPGESEIPRGR